MFYFVITAALRLCNPQQGPKVLIVFWICFLCKLKETLSKKKAGVSWGLESLFLSHQLWRANSGVFICMTHATGARIKQQSGKTMPAAAVCVHKVVKKGTIFSVQTYQEFVYGSQDSGGAVSYSS